MKPDDSNGSRDIQSRPYRVLLIADPTAANTTVPGEGFTRRVPCVRL